MRCITRVHPAWLAALAPALTVISEPLDNPSPRFNEKTGFKHVFYEMTYWIREMECYVKATYAQKWDLPISIIPFPDRIEKYRYFAHHLLRGVVAQEIKNLQVLH